MVQLNQDWWEQDFHLHTTYSDGSLRPMELLESLAALGVRHVAITDHESVRAYRELDAHRLPTGLELHPGIELDCQWQDYEVHLLGLDFQPDHPELEAYLEHIHQVRRVQYMRLMEAINRELREEFLTPETVFPPETDTWMKPHIFQRLGQHPRFQHLDPEDRYRFFKEWLADRGLRTEIPRPTLAEGIRLIHRAGGYAVLAHPGYYWKHGMAFPDSLRVMKEMGLDGLEVFYPYYQPNAPEFPTEASAIETVLTLYQWGQEFRLLMTRGSDIHRPEHRTERYRHLRRVRQAVEALSAPAPLDVRGPEGAGA